MVMVEGERELEKDACAAYNKGDGCIIAGMRKYKSRGRTRASESRAEKVLRDLWIYRRVYVFPSLRDIYVRTNIREYFKRGLRVGVY